MRNEKGQHEGMTKLETMILEKAQLMTALGPLQVHHASVDPVAAVCRKLSSELDALCEQWLKNPLSE